MLRDIRVRLMQAPHQHPRLHPLRVLHRPPVTKSSQIRFRFGILLCMFGLIGCQTESVPPSESDASTPYMNRCGDGENRMAIGIKEPFEPATTQTGTDGVERHQFSVYEGHQGGYHIDVSIRIEGGIGPGQCAPAS